MATVQTTLALQDKMSSILRSVTTAMHSTLVAVRSLVPQGTELGASFGKAAADLHLAQRAVDDFNNSTNKLGSVKGVQLSSTFIKASEDIKNTERAVGDVGHAMDKLEGIKRARLGESFVRAAGDAKNTEKAVRDLGDSVNRLKGTGSVKLGESFKKTAADTKLAERAVKDLSDSVNKIESNRGSQLGESFIRTADDIKNIIKAMKDLNGETEKIGGSSAIPRFTQNIFTAQIAVDALRKAIGFVQQNISSAFGRIDTIELFSSTMTALTGDANAANAALNELKDITTGTAYGLDVAAKSMQAFVASGLDVNQSIQQVRMWGDAVAFYGEGSNRAFTSVTEAINRMIMTGTVQQLQLKTLTTESVPALRYYADAVGMSTAEVTAAVRRSEISTANFLNVTTKAFTEGTKNLPPLINGAKDAGKTWATTFANMKAATTRGLLAIVSSIDNTLNQMGFPTMRQMLVDLGLAMESALKSVSRVMADALKIMGPVFHEIIIGIQTLNESWSQIDIRGAIANIVEAIGAMASAAIEIIVPIFQQIGQWVQFAVENMGTIIPIISSMALALGVLAVAVNIYTAAQWLMNAALWANPITWVVAIIIALIGIIYAAVEAINNFAGTSVSATGAIFSGFSMLGAFLWNGILAILELALGVINRLVNPYIRFANFLRNVFKDPISAIIYSFQDMGDGILGILEKIASAIDFIFGSKMADTVAGWRSTLKGLADAAVESRGFDPKDFETAGLDLSVKDLGLERIAYKDAWSAGYSAGENLENVFKTDMFQSTGVSKDYSNYKTQMPPASAIPDELLTSSPGGGGGQALKTAEQNEVNINAEDLRMLLDISAAGIKVKYTELTPQVAINLYGDIRETVDIDNVIERLATEIEDIASSDLREGYVW